MIRVPRRRSINILSAVALLAIALPTPGAFGQAKPVRIALVYDTTMRDVQRGARMAAQEATRAAQLLGHTFTLQEVPFEATKLNFDADAVVLAVGVSALAAAGRTLLHNGFIVLNAGVPARDFELLCARRFFTVLPPGDVPTWHESLERYGAAQLNDRYRALYQTGMTSAAWSGWFGVKVLWESMLRSRTRNSDELARYLTSDAAAFDGHKGQPLRFDPGTRELQQPLYQQTTSGIQQLNIVPNTAVRICK